MPLVRIFTRLPEYPTELVRNLRSRGFDVETCVPRDTQHTADLEITLDLCSLESLPEVILGAAEQKDIYILANPEAQSCKIRSVGMLMFGSKENVESVQKTVVPPQIVEIYTALLRERLTSEKSAYENWKPRVRRIAGTVGQQALSTSEELFIYCSKKLEVVGKKFAHDSQRALKYIWQMPARFTAWYESRIFGRQGQAARPAFKLDDSKIDAELIPSMFNLSGDQQEITYTVEESEQLASIASSSHVSATGGFRLWKGLALGSVAAVIILFVVQGLSHAPASAKDKNSSRAESSVTTLPDLQNSGKIQKVNTAVIAEPTTLKAVHKLSSEDNYFDQVVVRHFSQRTPSAMHAKNGMKRRVVVD